MIYVLDFFLSRTTTNGRGLLPVFGPSRKALSISNGCMRVQVLLIVAVVELGPRLDILSVPL